MDTNTLRSGDDPEISVTVNQTEIQIANSSIAALKKQLCDAELQIKVQDAQIEELKSANRNLATSNENETAVLRKKLYKLEKQMLACSVDHFDREQFVSHLKTSLKSVLTENQIDVILGRKKRPQWTANETSTAFAIRYLSKRCYVFLRNQLQYPLPGLTTLSSHAQRIDMRSGLLGDMLQSMRIVGKYVFLYQYTFR